MFNNNPYPRTENQVDELRRQLRTRDERLVELQKNSYDEEKRLQRENLAQLKAHHDIEKQQAEKHARELVLVQQNTLGVAANTLEKSNERHVELRENLAGVQAGILLQGDQLRTVIKDQSEESYRKIKDTSDCMELALCNRLNDGVQKLQTHTQAVGSVIVNELERNARAVEEKIDKNAHELTLVQQNALGVVSRAFEKAEARQMEMQRNQAGLRARFLSEGERIRTLIQDQSDENYRKIKQTSNHMEQTLSNRFDDGVQELQTRTQAVGTVIVSKLERNAQEVDDKMDTLNSKLKDQGAMMQLNAQDARQRDSAITQRLSRNVRTITSQADKVKANIIQELETKTHQTEDQAASRHDVVNNRLKWITEVTEMQNESIKELRTYLTRPSQTSRLFSWLRRHCCSQLCRCSCRSYPYLSNVPDKLEDGRLGENGAVILYGRSNSSRKIAEQVWLAFHEQNFLAVEPRPYYDELPSCNQECLLAWLIVYAILQEDQGTKEITNVIKKIDDYVTNSCFQDCKVLVIIQCKWLPGGDVLTPLRSLQNATAMIAMMRYYHDKVFKPHLTKFKSFDDVVKRIVADAKTRPRCIVKV